MASCSGPLGVPPGSVADVVVLGRVVGDGPHGARQGGQRGLVCPVLVCQRQRLQPRGERLGDLPEQLVVVPSRVRVEC